MGIPISFMGAFWLMPFFDVTINMMSLFAFILALGIVVDDAIVVGENIFSYRQKGMGHVEAAIIGVKEMCGPVVMAVLTTLFAFFPLLYLLGVMGKFIRVIPILVICVLSFSLLAALLILPAHLVHAKIEPVDEEDLFNPQRHIPLLQRVPRFFQKIKRHTQHGLHRLIHDH